MRRLLTPLLAAALLAGAGSPLALRADAAAAKPGDDVVVVAVIDSGIAPYHWDFLAAKTPQALTRTKADDLPLDKAPHTWIKGFPKPSSFDTYKGVKLTLDAKDETRRLSELKTQDQAAWDSLEHSGPDAVNYYWFPGTKVIGGVSFGYEEQSTQALDEGTGFEFEPVYGTGHGLGSSSVAAGNLRGTCPECVVVSITTADTTSTERALAWAQSQPWIDVVTNSYGLQTVPVGYVRDGLYGGPVEQQRTASERGQTIVFSAGNGIENGFVVPFSTLTSSVKGPDWVITVGATHPSNKAQYSGSGKPVDVAGIGESYPSAYNATSVNGGSRFSGTSNAAPTVAGTYARGLHLARKAMAGPSRTQANGVISVGKAACGKARPKCEVGDGKLTAVELRHRLMKGAVSSGGGTTPAGVVPQPRLADEHFAAEGHGTYYARLKQDDALWLEEFHRFFDPVVGKAAELKRPVGEDQWFVVDSWCRQHVFGAWKDGYYKEGVTQLPSVDPPGAPVRAALQVGCNGLTKLPGTPRP